MKDLTQGSVRGHIWSMTLFMLVTMFVQTLYNVIDLYFVGRLGKEAVAAVSVAGNLQMIVIALTQMLGVGAAAVLSHAAGRRDRPRVELLFNEALSLSIALGIAFAIGSWLMSDWYCRTLSSDADTARLAKRFLIWFIPAMALQFPLAGLSASLRGLGSMRAAMFTQVATILLNIVLAPMLMFGWGTGLSLGVEGASLATFLAILTGTLGLVLYLRRRESALRIHFASWRPDLKAWRSMLGIGLPAGAELAVMGLYLVFIYLVIRPFGAEAQAGFGIGMRIMHTGFMPAMAVSFACAAVAGQNFGAGQFARVRETFRSGLLIASGIMVFFTVLCHVAPAAMIRPFSDDPAVIQIGTDYLRIISWNYVAFGVIVSATGTMQGLGNTWPALISSAARIGLIVLPVWWLSTLPDFHINWIWWTSMSSVVVQMGLILYFLRRELARRLDPPSAGAAAPEPAS